MTGKTRYKVGLSKPRHLVQHEWVVFIIKQAWLSRRLNDISTPSFNSGPFNTRLFNHELFNPGLFNHEFLNHEVENFMVEKSGVEKLGVEMSFNILER